MRLLSFFLLLLSLFQSGLAQELVSDPLLAPLEGRWRLSGDMKGKPLDQLVEARWALRGQFLQMTFSSPEGAAVPYQAEMWIGKDHEGYVAHLLDQFGAAPSRVLGLGKEGPLLVLEFAYPDAEFRQTFQRDGADWVIEIDSRDPGGPWQRWATKRLTLLP